MIRIAHPARMPAATGRRLTVALASATLVLGLSACGSDGDDPPTTTGITESPVVTSDAGGQDSQTTPAATPADSMTKNPLDAPTSGLQPTGMPTNSQPVEPSDGLPTTTGPVVTTSPEDRPSGFPTGEVWMTTKLEAEEAPFSGDLTGTMWKLSNVENTGMPPTTQPDAAADARINVVRFDEGGTFLDGLLADDGATWATNEKDDSPTWKVEGDTVILTDEEIRCEAPVAGDILDFTCDFMGAQAHMVMYRTVAKPVEGGPGAIPGATATS